MSLYGTFTHSYDPDISEGKLYLQQGADRLQRVASLAPKPCTAVSCGACHIGRIPVQSARWTLCCKTTCTRSTLAGSLRRPWQFANPILARHRLMCFVTTTIRASLRGLYLIPSSYWPTDTSSIGHALPTLLATISSWLGEPSTREYPHRVRLSDVIPVLFLGQVTFEVDRLASA